MTLLFFFFAAVFGIFVLARSHAHLAEQAAMLPVLKEENARYAAHLDHLQSEITLLQNHVAELDALGNQVRDIVNGRENKTQIALLPSRGGQRSDTPPEESVAYLKEKLPQKMEEMHQLVFQAEQYRLKMAATPDLWPVIGRVTSPFGRRTNPLSHRTDFHQGIDIAASAGAAVRSAADGVVRRAGYQPGWGNLVVVDHGIYRTYYAHLQRFRVKAGQAVTKGQIIGAVGSTGASTGPHLHFEIHAYGKPVDPATILSQEASDNGF